MAHAVHTTNAVVLSSADVQDADKLFWLLTKDFGLVFASARSVRREASKLRYSLQDLAQVDVSIVRGKGLWRITGAQYAGMPALSVTQQQVFGRIATLVRRVMPTDEENDMLFTIMTTTRAALMEEESDAEAIERLAVARVLYQLGYLSCTPEYTGLIDTLTFDADALTQSTTLKDVLLLDINAGLNESQL